MLLYAEITRAVVSPSFPSCLTNCRHKHEPSKHSVAIPSKTLPGGIGHIDTGHFVDPQGPFTRMVHADVFSSHFCVDMFSSNHPSADDVVRVYLREVQEIYEEC